MKTREKKFEPFTIELTFETIKDVEEFRDALDGTGVVTDELYEILESKLNKL